MEKKLQDKIYKKYPKIFVRRKLPMTQTCMCWGLACSDGWYKLIDLLCANLQWDTDHNDYPQIEATQVKEKYGTLRFYYSYAEGDTKCDERKHGYQDGMISFAEQMSGYICEKCGSTIGVTQTKGWIISLCASCMKEYKKKRGIKK